MNYFIHLSCCVCLLWVGGKWSDHCLLPFIKKNTAAPPVPRSRVSSPWCALTLSNTRASICILFLFIVTRHTQEVRRAMQWPTSSFIHHYSLCDALPVKDHPKCHCSSLLFDRRRSIHLRLLLLLVTYKAKPTTLFISLACDVQLCLSGN